MYNFFICLLIPQLALCGSFITGIFTNTWKEGFRKLLKSKFYPLTKNLRQSLR